MTPLRAGKFRIVQRERGSMWQSGDNRQLYFGNDETGSLGVAQERAADDEWVRRAMRLYCCAVQQQPSAFKLDSVGGDDSDFFLRDGRLDTPQGARS